MAQLQIYKHSERTLYILKSNTIMTIIVVQSSADYELFSLIRILFGAWVVVVVVVSTTTSAFGQQTERSVGLQTVGGLLRIAPL